MTNPATKIGWAVFGAVAGLVLAALVNTFDEWRYLS